MEDVSQNLGTDDYPITRLFKAACTSEDSGSSAQPENVYITSADQWRTLSDSLASEGFVTELSEQQQLQKIWDRAVVSSNAFGRSGKPCLSLEDVLRCVDEMYADDHSKEVDLKILNAQRSVRQLEALLKAWDIHSFNLTQTRQALQLLERFEKGHHRTVEDLDKECGRQVIKDAEALQKGKALIVERVRRLVMRNSDTTHAYHRQRCNPLQWQLNNAGLVEQKVAKNKVRILRYPANHNASDEHHSGRHSFGEMKVEDDKWGVSQGLAGSQGIYCRRGIATRNNEEISVTVVVMPKVHLGYLARERLWTGYLAHRQLAAGRCVMHSLGYSDCDRRETLFYFEHAIGGAWQASDLLSTRRLREKDILFRHWARCTLACLAQLSEQSTYTLRRRLSTSNIMITDKGTAIRLGGVQWGSDMRGETHFQQTLDRKDAELCLSYADMLEDLLINNDRLSSDDDPSVMLTSILACLRLPPQQRKGITLKGLLGHDYFQPIPLESVRIAWKAFVDQATTESRCLY